MALTDKLTAIGDAIRGKTGDSSLLSLDDMATAITDIQTAGAETGALDGYNIPINAWSGHTGEFIMTIPSSIYVNGPRGKSDQYLNWILFFPILTAANTYGTGVAVCHHSAFGNDLWSETDTTTGYVYFRKTAQIITPTTNDFSVQNSGSVHICPFLQIMSNVNVSFDVPTGIRLKNTSNTTYPRAVAGTGRLIYWNSSSRT